MKLLGHTFSMLWSHFGPFGDQDVHFHPCVKDVEDDVHDCSFVIVGDGRTCKGENDKSHRLVDLDKNPGGR